MKLGHTIIAIPIVYFIKMACIASISVVDGSVALTGKASVGVLDSLLIISEVGGSPVT